MAISNSSDVIKASMSDYKVRQKHKASRGSRTPGSSKRSDTCQLTSVGGLPRKAFMRARSYKMREYPTWVKFVSDLNK